MKGQGEQKSPVGGRGGNPVRHRELNATPRMHPGNRHVVPGGEGAEATRMGKLTTDLLRTEGGSLPFLKGARRRAQECSRR